MKKICSVIIAFSIITSCCFLTVFSAAADSAGAYENKTDVLKMAEIVGESFVPSADSVGRGYFADILINAAGMKAFVGDIGNTGFSDVAPEDNYSYEIALAKSLGFINGYSNGCFYPERNISVLEAMICVLRLLGYEKKAIGMGGYPAGYYSVINELKLASGIEGSYLGELSNKDMVELIYNALHTKVISQTVFGSDKVRYETKDGETLLYNSFKIYYTEGVVNGVDITNLFGENDLPPYSVYIGDNVYYSGQFPMNNLLGYYVRAYYKEENSKLRIKYADINTRKNNEKIINIKDIAKISSNTVIRETADGGFESASFAARAPVIYNGTNTSEAFDINIYKDEDGKNLKGYVKLLDNNGDKKADVVFVEAYTELIAGRIDYEYGKVYDYSSRREYHLLCTEKNEPYVVLYNSENEEISVNEISEGSSIILFTSKPDSYQKYVRGYVSNEKIKGKMTTIEDGEDEISVVIDDQRFVISDYAVSNSIGLVPGRTMEATLNIYGEIARIIYESAPADYELAMLDAVKKKSSFEGEIIARVMNSDGSFSVVPFKDTVKIDGNDYKTAARENDILSLLRRSAEACGAYIGNYYFQVIKYGMDNEGRINYIDTILNSEGEITKPDQIKAGNELFFGKTEGKYYNSTNMIGQKIIVNNDSVVFMYPDQDHAGDLDYYGVNQKSYFKDNGSYNGVSYFKEFNEDYAASVYLVGFKSSAIGGDITNFKSTLIKKITNVVNTNGEQRLKLYLYCTDGTESELLIDPGLETSDTTKTKAEKLSSGDIIYYYTNDATGEISDYIICYSHANEMLYDISATNNYMKKAVIIDATANGIKYILEEKITPDLAAASTGTNCVIYNNQLKNVYRITVFDTERKKAVTGSYNDLDYYCVDPAVYSTVILRCYGSSTIAREMILYK